jgi:phytoene desaturase
MKEKKKENYNRVGFSALSAASYLAKGGHEVVVYEKMLLLVEETRRKDGFTFDMGPSWYWMPDVFDRFFADFGRRQLIIMSSSSYLLIEYTLVSMNLLQSQII